MTIPHERRALLDAYAARLNRLINQTVTASRLVLVQTPTDRRIGRAILTRVQGGARALELGRQQWLLLEQVLQADEARGSVDLVAYTYVYSSGPNPAAEDAWIFRYEYDRAPDPDFPYSAAHVHVNVSEGRQVGRKLFKKLHLPSGYVEIEPILRHLILEFDVPTVGQRDAALALLAPR